MKRPILTLIILATALTAVAQATQPCIVKQYNQKQQKTPLAGVQVEVRGAQTATSAANGSVTLQFATLKPGDRVPFRAATKAGYELMNKTAVEQWNISRDQKPFEIVLIQSAYFTQLKGNLKQSSVDSYHQKYEQTLAELERQKKEGKLKEQEYYDKLNELEDRYDNQLKNLDAYVDQFARIDLSELSEQEQQFIELAHAGRLDEAAEAYNALNAAGKYITAVENVRKLNGDIAKLEDEKARQQETANAFFAMLQRQVNTLKLAGGEENYRKAGELLKRAALADTTNVEVVWEYAFFAYGQGEFKDAEPLLYICLRQKENAPIFISSLSLLSNLLRQKQRYKEVETVLLIRLKHMEELYNNDSDPYFLLLLASAQNDLGDLYSDLQNYTKAEEYYLQALENFTQLFQQEPDSYRSNLASTQINLGDLYKNLNNYSKAEEYYIKALENFTLFLAQNPDEYEGVARTQWKLGHLYFVLKKYDKAEDLYLKAEENYILLFNKNPDAYREDLTIPQFLLAILYNYNLEDYVKAEKYYLKALENFTPLFSQKPENYHEIFAERQKQLADLYIKHSDFAKAEGLYLKMLEHYTPLFNKKPEIYSVSLTDIQHQLWNLYVNQYDYEKSEELYLKAIGNTPQLFSYLKDMADTFKSMAGLSLLIKDYSNAEENLIKALDCYTQLFSQNPDVYRDDLAGIQKKLGNLYSDLHDYAKAEDYYLKALENRTQLFSQNPDKYRKDLADTQHNLGNLYYLYLQNYTKAEEYYLKALENRSQLFVQDSSSDNCNNLAWTQYRLGTLYNFRLNDYAKAKEYYLKALENRTHLFSQNPDAYRADLATTQNSLGALYNNLHDYSKSEEYYLKASENRTQLFSQNPDKYRKDLADTQHNLGNLYYLYLQNYTKAEEYYLKALENRSQLFVQDSSSNNCNNLAWTQYRLGSLYNSDLHDYAKAEEYMLKALENFTWLFTQNPDTYREGLANSYNELAYVYAHTQDYAKALDTIDRVIALMPEEANFYDSKGEILLMKGDEQEALKMWRKVLEVDPDFLQKYEGGTDFYKQLKEKGLVE